MKKRNNSNRLLEWSSINVFYSIIWIVALLLPGAFIAEAQPIGIKPGDRVRVSAENIPYEVATGIIVNVYSDHMQMAMGVQQVDIPWNELYSLDVRREKRKTLKGGAIGFTAGGFLGAVIGFTSYEKCVPEELFDCVFHPKRRADATLTGALLGALPGGVIGLIAGATTKRYSWENVRLGLSVNPYRSANNFSAYAPTVNVRIQFGTRK